MKQTTQENTGAIYKGQNQEETGDGHETMTR